MVELSMQGKLSRAMAAPERWVVEMSYVDSKGVESRRVVSPIRFVGGRRFLALCLCREEPRQFYLERCKGVELLAAEEVMMPVAMG